MSFIVRLGCRECTGVDSQGCFDGGTDYIYDKDTLEVKNFPEFWSAYDAGWEEVDGVPWWFEVLDRQDKIVLFDSASPHSDEDWKILKEKYGNRQH